MQHQAREQLDRQLGKIRRIGEPDTFSGKRAWTRFQADRPVELRTTPDAEPCTARLHNISGGGIGIWSQTNMAEAGRVEIRLSGADAWLPGEIVSRSVGLQGYLLGIRFDHPLQTEDPAHPEPQRAAPPARHTHLLESLLAAVLIAMTASLPVLGPVWLGALRWDFTTTMIAQFGCILLAGICGLLALRLATRTDRRFELEIARTLTGIARGSQQSLVPWAPSHAARMLRRSVIRFRDTLRQREDDERQRRQKLEELNLIKTNILSMVSHDLRTPLTSILLYTQMLREDLGKLSMDDQQKFLGVISSECTRLTRLVDDLLEAQRLESGRTRWKMAKVDLAAPILSCAEVFVVMAQAKQTAMTIDCPESLPPIEADVDKVSQILSNLLSNAVKYTPDGGAIHLQVMRRSDEIVISVRDNGPGIPRDQWDQIFDRFSQLSATQYIRDLPGVGLGLFIVKQIVERHGGRVWVDSEVGQGSSFSVALPIARDESVEQHETGENFLARVVVCDADPEVATRMAQMLRAQRYDVRMAHSACRLLAHAEQGECDVIVTDVLLPDMDAPEVIAGLTDRGDRPYRIVLHSFAGDTADLRSRGIDIVLRRPAGRDELLQAVRMACLNARNASTVLVVGNDGWRTELLRHGIAEKGWMPIIVDRLEEAEGFLGRYPVDMLLISEDALHGDRLGELAQEHQETRCIIVTAGKPSAATRRLADQKGCEIVTHRPGEETELLERISLDGASLEIPQ